MGYYVNPEDGRSKEEFLAQESEEVTIKTPNFEQYSKDGCLPVVLVDNGEFTAAGIAYDKREFEAFTLPSDRRPKMFFKVKIEKLFKHSDLRIYLDHNKI